ncbi:RNA polymerase sigma factor [Patescibacteria group bacterium]|nr:MAG: RNA polymerase sigma factor [Patescibacteria group bacterium]
MDEEIDKQLVKRYLEGDESAFPELLQRHLKSVYNFLYHIVHDQSALDDLTQETFVKAWKNLKRFDQSKKFRTWLFTIAKNTAFDYLKKKKSIPFSNFLDAEGYSKLEQISDEALLSDELLALAGDKANLEKELQQISEHYRAILLMHYQDDLSLNEVAAILGKPYNTVKSSHARALASLRKILITKDGK